MPDDTEPPWNPALPEPPTSSRELLRIRHRGHHFAMRSAHAVDTRDYQPQPTSKRRIVGWRNRTGQPHHDD